MVEKKKLVIIPTPNKKFIHGVTIDIRLGNQFYTFCQSKKYSIDLSKSKNEIALMLQEIMSKKKVISNSERFVLKPKSLALAVTLEKVVMPNDLVGWIDGRSSLARLGLMIHATAHRIDPGWSGNIVLEFFNSGNMILTLCPGMLIGALSFELLSSPSLRPYNMRRDAKYFNQDGVTLSKIYED